MNNKSIALEKLGPDGYLLANTLMPFLEKAPERKIADFWIGKTWFSVTIAYGNEDGFEKTEEEIKEKIKEI